MLLKEMDNHFNLGLLVPPTSSSSQEDTGGDGVLTLATFVQFLSGDGFNLDAVEG